MRTSIEKPAPGPEEDKTGRETLSPRIVKTKLVNEDGEEIKKSHHGKVIKTKIEKVDKDEIEDTPKQPS